MKQKTHQKMNTILQTTMVAMTLADVAATLVGTGYYGKGYEQNQAARYFLVNYGNIAFFLFAILGIITVLGISWYLSKYKKTKPISLAILSLFTILHAIGFASWVTWT